jgi:hypothetical protein
VLATLLFVAFVTYFYVPDLVFRFAAASVYSLRRLRSDSQVAEFFAAALPSFFVNVPTLAVFIIVRRLVRHVWFLPDLEKLKPLLLKDPSVSAITSHDLVGPLFYLATLYADAYLLGLLYGEESRDVAAAGGILEYFSDKSFARYTFYRFWFMFYSHYLDTFYPIVLRSSIAYVHTKAAIFYGRIVLSDKDRDGETESIYLINVSKYDRGDQDKMLERGENPITSLSGPMYIRWSEVLDINFPLEPDDTLERKRLYFEERLRNAPYQGELRIRYDKDDIN